MNYIFFDIECANCQYGQAKICSFGYVITNERFEVIKKEDIVINPRAPFMLSGRGNRPYIKLAYSKEVFRASPLFSAVYPHIRTLLTMPDSLVFGYAADNDASYLKSEFQRYGLPCVDFSYYDLQKLLRFACPRENAPGQTSLQTAVGLFYEKSEQEIHKSDDDAYMTMQVLRGISERTGLSPIRLLERYPVCRGDLRGNNVLIRFLEGDNILVKILGDKSDRISPKSENRTMYTRFVRHVKPSDAPRPLWLRGKKVCIPEKYAEKHFHDAIKLIQLICDCGGRYTLIADDCQYFVTFPVYDEDGTQKISAEQTRILNKRPINRAKFLSAEQFFTNCGMTEEEFRRLPAPDVRYLLSDKYAPQPRVKKGQTLPARRTPPVKKTQKEEKDL